MVLFRPFTRRSLLLFPGFSQKISIPLQLHTPKLFWVRKYSVHPRSDFPSEDGGDSLSTFIQRAIEAANRQNELHTKKKLKVQEVAYRLEPDPLPIVKLQPHELSLGSGGGLGDFPDLLIQVHHSEDATLLKLERRFEHYLSSSHIHKPETGIFTLDSISAPSAHLDIAKRCLTYHLKLRAPF
jgi:hypothetical protein